MTGDVRGDFLQREHLQRKPAAGLFFGEIDLHVMGFHEFHKSDQMVGENKVLGTAGKKGDAHFRIFQGIRVFGVNFTESLIRQRRQRFKLMFAEKGVRQVTDEAVLGFDRFL